MKKYEHLFKVRAYMFQIFAVAYGNLDHNSEKYTYKSHS